MDHISEEDVMQSVKSQGLYKPVTKANVVKWNTVFFSRFLYKSTAMKESELIYLEV